MRDEATALQAQRRPHYAWVIAGTTALVNGVAWGIPQGTFGVFFSPLTEEMGWSRVAVSAAFSIILLVNATFGIFWGWLSDRWSIRWTMAITGALMGAGIFLIEGITNLHLVKKRRFMLHAAPIKLKDCEAAPARIYAVV